MVGRVCLFSYQISSNFCRCLHIILWNFSIFHDLDLMATGFYFLFSSIILHFIWDSLNNSYKIKEHLIKTRTSNGWVTSKFQYILINVKRNTELDSTINKSSMHLMIVRHTHSHPSYSNVYVCVTHLCSDQMLFECIGEYNSFIWM